jgi:pimeloyl-ACP methyl ester carboxylesterase
MSLRSFCSGKAMPWFAIAVGVLVALTSKHSCAAEPAHFQDLRVEVVGTGRPVLMIPGLGSAASVWTETCAALQPGVQCHLVQLPGFAGAPAVQKAQWLESMRDELLAYEADRGLKQPVVMGHSLGGVLTLMMAAKAPAAAKRYVIVDSLPFLAGIRNPNASAEDARRMAAPMREALLKASDEESERQFRASAAGMTRSPERAKTIAAWGMASDRATVAQSMSELWAADLRPLLPRIDRPVLVLGSWAAYEPMGATLESTGALFRHQYEGLNGVQVRMSERGYHFLMWDDPDWLVSEVKAFIGQ